MFQMKWKTYELFKLAVGVDPQALKYIPSEFINKELCEYAFEKNSFAYIYIPNEMKTSEIDKKFNASLRVFGIHK